MREIKSVREISIMVDDDMFEFLNKWRWYIDSCGYATSQNYDKNTKKRNNIKMHRVITSCPAELQVDHINHNTLDNRRENLRIVDRCQNLMNMGLRRTSKSGFKGVCWENCRTRWRVRIQANKKMHYLGRFLKIEDAALAYRKGQIKYHGEYAPRTEEKILFYKDINGGI